MARQLSGREINEIRSRKRKSDADKVDNFITELSIVENSQNLSHRDFKKDFNQLEKRLKIDEFNENEELIVRENRALCVGGPQCLLCGADIIDVEKFCRDFANVPWI